MKAVNLRSLNMQFQHDWPKDKKYSSFKFLPEKFPSAELYDAPLEGSTFFSLSQLLGPYVVGKLSIS